MSNQTPQGAQQYTAEEAAEIVARVKAGLPHKEVIDTTVTMPTTEPPPPSAGAEPAEPAEPDKFVTVNPPLGVWRPRDTEHQIRGYLLAVQVDAVSGAAFYVVQLTAECGYIGAADECSWVEGDHVAVYDAPTTKALRSMMPQYDAQGTCLAAYEVIIAPHRRNPFGWDYLIQARRVIRPSANRPGFACVPDIPPHGEIVDAAGNLQSRAEIDETDD